MSEFAHAAERLGDDPAVVFVYQGTADQAPMFFDQLHPGATAIADPDGDLSRAFAIRRGGWREMFGWRAWRAGFTAVRQGHFVNRKIGDPWTLPTIFAVRGTDVVAEFRGTHAGDHPDVDRIIELAGADA